MRLEKYVGSTVRIVYIDKKNQITQRQIEIKSIVDGRIRAHCLKSNGPRVFALTNVLAFELVQRNAG